MMRTKETGARVLTFGCRLNSYESEVMRAQANSAGMQDAVIVNSCAVTSEAVRQTRQAIRRARRDDPDARIIVTGCAAQIEPDRFAAMPEVDMVLGNQEKLHLQEYEAVGPGAARTDGHETQIHVGDIMAAQETPGHLVSGLEARARAVVQVQNGCNHRCTFCVIPFGRGNSRSVHPDAIIDQVRELVANGYREVVLTGVDITAYGADLPGAISLGHLLTRILTDVPGLPRLRLSSLDPVEVDDRLFDVLTGDARVMPHLHLSLQSGDDMVLKRMKRRHSRADAVAFCDRFRATRPEVAFGADLIAGFPTEADDMFQNSLNLISDCGLTFLHVFPYSPRPGTPAARMPQVPGDIRKARAAELRAAGEQALGRHLQGLEGKRLRVLMETPTSGRAECFAQVDTDRQAEPGTIIDVMGAKAIGNRLQGRIVT